MSSPSKKSTTLLFKKLVVPVGMRSIYWKYFGFPGNDEGEILTREKIVCTLCRTQMAYNGNTSNLRMHLQNKHGPHLINLEATTPPYVPKSRGKVRPTKRRADTNPVVHAISFAGAVELGSAPQPPQNQGIKFISIGGDDTVSPNVEYISSDSLGDTVTYYLPEDGASSSGNNRFITDTVTRFLTSELLTPNIIEGHGFQRLISKLNPSITIPTSKHLDEEYIPQQYEELKNGIMSEFETLNEYSLSAEEWKGINDQSFVTFSAHFLHDEQLVTRTLPTIQWSKENKELVGKTLSLWGIQQENIVAIITAATDTELIATLNEWAPTVPCFLSILEQAVTSCLNLPEVETVIEKCRAILSNFKLQQSFADVQFQCYSIQLDYPKLWTSTYELLSEFSNSKSEIQTLVDTNSGLELSASDWKVLNTIVDVLSAFKVTVQTLQEETPALLSIIKPLLWQLVTNYLQIKDDESDLSETMKILLKSKLSNAYNSKSNNLLLQTATTLDPRFKQLSYATEEEGSLVQTNIKTLLSQIVTEHGEQASTPSIAAPPPPKKKLSGMELLLGDLCSIKQEMRPENRADLELGQYTSETPVAFDDNPLIWWHNAESKCPNMCRLAKKYMCIPACAIPSSRIPNKTREIFERQRATLSLDYVDKIIFLNGNLL